MDVLAAMAAWRGAALACVMLASGLYAAWRASAKGYPVVLFFAAGALVPVAVPVAMRLLPDRTDATRYDALERSQRLLAAGAITRGEYERVKRRVLGSW